MHRMDRIYRIFSGNGGLAVLDIRKSLNLHPRSLPLVQQPPIRMILCILYILCIDVQSSCSRQAMNFSCFTLG